MKNENVTDNIGIYFNRRTPFWKKTVDLLGSFFGLLILSPVFLVISLAVKVNSSGPVFFKQLRGGIGGEPFYLYKFRTMVDNAESMRDNLLAFNERSGPVFKMTADPRITGVGKILRKWSLDELPQLINVFRGDMSLVGPRPLPIPEEKAMNQWHRIRRMVKPGITCLWQISDRNEMEFDDWIRLDIRYVKNYSLWMDIKILLLTIPVVLYKKNL